MKFKFKKCFLLLKKPYSYSNENLNLWLLRARQFRRRFSITINYQRLLPYFDILKNIALYQSYLYNKKSDNKSLIFLKKYADQFILLSEIFPNSQFKKKLENHIKKNNPKEIFISKFEQLFSAVIKIPSPKPSIKRDLEASTLTNMQVYLRWRLP